MGTRNGVQRRQMQQACPLADLPLPPACRFRFLQAGSTRRLMSSSYGGYYAVSGASALERTFRKACGF